MYKYLIYYDGGLIHDSFDNGYTYEDDEDAFIEASDYIDSKIADWKADEVEYDKDLFTVEVQEVKQ